MGIERLGRGCAVGSVLSLLICCGGSAGGSDDGGTPKAARDVGSGALESWVGTASGSIGGSFVEGLATEAEVTWVALTDQPVPGQTVYAAQGRVSYRDGSCSVIPAEVAIEGHSGATLIVDWTRSPPEYSASGGSMWMASVRCDDAPVDAPVGGVWLADPSTVDQSARGVLTDDGTAIEASATFGDPRAVQFTFHWAFRKAN